MRAINRAGASPRCFRFQRCCTVTPTMAGTRRWTRGSSYRCIPPPSRRGPARRAGRRTGGAHLPPPTGPPHGAAPPGMTLPSHLRVYRRIRSSVTTVAPGVDRRRRPRREQQERQGHGVRAHVAGPEAARIFFFWNCLLDERGTNIKHTRTFGALPTPYCDFKNKVTLIVMYEWYDNKFNLHLKHFHAQHEKILLQIRNCNLEIAQCTANSPKIIYRYRARISLV